MKGYCKHIPVTKALEHLKSLKEWDLVDYFNPDRIDQAKVFASTGQFSKAVRTLDAIRTEPEGNQPNRMSEACPKTNELLLSYLLMVGSEAQNEPMLKILTLDFLWIFNIFLVFNKFWDLFRFLSPQELT